MKRLPRVSMVVGQMVAVLVLVLSGTGTGTSVLGQSADRFMAFVDVTVIPMDSDRALLNHTVVVNGDRIWDLGPSAEVDPPPGATRIDGQGKYLMPGLAEMHGHTVSNSGSATFSEQVMFLYAANGVTTVRGMLGLDGDLELKAKTNSGEIWGPTLYLAGPSFSGGSVSSPGQAAARVRAQKTEGWDHLKIHPGLSRAEYDAVARTAAEVGLRFAGHVPADVGLVHAIKMGQETFDHLDGYLAHLDAIGGPIDDGRLAEIIALTKSAHAWVVPTMVLWEVGVIGLGETDELAGLPEMRYWPRERVASWVSRHRQAQDRPGFDRAAGTRHAANRTILLKALSDAGVGILMGTDSPQVFSVPGFSLHREMRAMADAGMTSYEILRSGTANVGAYFQRYDAFGTIGVGRRADLILLNSDPLTDVANVADRAGVMVRGQWMSETDIQERLEEIAAAFGNAAS